MKKLIFSLLATILFFVTACNKNQNLTPSVPQKGEKFEKPITVSEANKMGVYDDSSQDIEEQLQVDDSKIMDLNTRSGSVTINSITSDTMSYSDDYGDYCGNQKLRGLNKISSTKLFTIRGSGFGASQGSSTVTITINNITYTINTISNQSGGSWSDTLIYAHTINSTPVIPDDLKNVTAKFTLKVGAETVTKSIKCLGELGHMRADRMDERPGLFAYGQAYWVIQSERAKLGKLFEFPISEEILANDGSDGFIVRLNYSYVPQVGDVLYRAPSLTNYNNDNFPRTSYQKNDVGVIHSVIANTDNTYTVTVYEMNMKCTGALQKKKYKYLFGLFIPKKGELPYYGYAR